MRQKHTRINIPYRASSVTSHQQQESGTEEDDDNDREEQIASKQKLAKDKMGSLKSVCLS